MTTESYWEDRTKPNTTIQCFHSQDLGNNLTDEPQNCDTFHNPDVSLVPGSSYLLAVNEGSGQVTQTVWLSSNGQRYICNYDRTAWTDATATATDCQVFSHPKQVENLTVLI